MSVIRLQEMTPQIYTEESRDFQLLSRLYDSVFNGLKFDTDSILDLIDTKECRTSVLQLLQTKLGFFTERKIDDEKLRSILECFPILVRNKGSLRAIKETLYLFLRMYSVSSNMEIYYLPTPYSPPFSEEEPCVLASGKLPENNSLIIRIHSFETKPDTSVMEEIFRYILPAGINYYIEFDKSATLQDIVLKSEDSAELTFVSDNINSQLRSSDQTEPYNIGTVNTSSLISTDSYVSNRFIGYYGDEQSASDYLATLVDKIYSTAVINYSATGEVSGPIVSISDAEAGAPVEALSVAIEPIQDLNGYEYPWPAGGGVNLVDSSILMNGSYNKYNIPNPLKNGQTYTYSVYGDDTYGYRLMAGHTNEQSPNPNIPVSSTYTRAGKKDTFVAPNDIEDYEYLFLGGSAPGAGSANIQIQVEKGNVANPTYHSYSNICPISGHTDADVTRTGKNLLDLSAFEFNDSTYIHAYDPLGAAKPLVDFLNEHKGQTFILSGTITGTASGAPIGQIRLYKAGESLITITPGTAFTVAPVNFSDTTTVYCYGSINGASFTDIQLQVGSTATAYEPYVGTTYPIPLGQTVYGGYVDVVTGEVWANKKYVDMGAVEWISTILNGEMAFYNYRSFTDIAPCPNNQTTELIAEVFRPVTANYLYANKNGTGIISVNSAKAVQLRDTRASTVSELVQLLDGVICVYPLATPVLVTTLTPTQIELLQGENNLWSDAGDISIRYKRDSTYKAMICTAYSSNTPTWHRINFLGNLTTEEVSTQGGIVAALQAKGITVNNGDLIKYNNLYLLRVNNDWQECNYARYILNTYHLTE